MTIDPLYEGIWQNPYGEGEQTVHFLSDSDRDTTAYSWCIVHCTPPVHQTRCCGSEGRTASTACCGSCPRDLPLEIWYCGKKTSTIDNR